MNKNLLWKTIFIVAVMLVFHVRHHRHAPTVSLERGLPASIQQPVHLGLDLRGGTHLILQVMVNDAVKADADNAIERLKTECVRPTSITPRSASLIRRTTPIAW